MLRAAETVSGTGTGTCTGTVPAGAGNVISVIVPLYNEGARVNGLLEHLRGLTGLREAVLVDASDEAASQAVIADLAERIRDDPFVRLVQCSAPGRAVQMNAGAARCGGSVLLFLHCDTRLPPTAAERIARRTNRERGRVWGWFDLRLDAVGPVYRVLEQMINLRARAFRIATGDQALFVERRVFAEQRGFAGIPLMEDVELSRRLKRLGPPAVIRRPVLTSARRWQKNGVLRTVLLMWKLRFLYWLGRSPERLAATYRNVR